MAAEHFRTATGSWEPMPALASHRSLFSVAVVSGRIYLIGGSDGRRSVALCERLNPVDGTWEAIPPLSSPRCSCGTGVVAGVLYVAGGLDRHMSCLQCERFDPAVHQWEPLQAQPKMCASSVAASVRGQLYILGLPGSETECERFDPRRGDWQQMSPVNPAVQPFGLAGAAGVGPRLCVLGWRLHEVRIFNTENSSWEPPPSVTRLPSCIRAGIASCVAASGDRLYIVGRWTEDSRGESAGVVEWNPSEPRNQHWNVLPFPGLASCCAAAVVLGRSHSSRSITHD